MHPYIRTISSMVFPGFRKSLLPLAVLMTAVSARASEDTPLAVDPVRGTAVRSDMSWFDRNFLFGDPWNIKSSLQSNGIVYDLQYVNDFFGVLGGPSVNGSGIDFGRLRFTVDIDLRRMYGVDGLSFHVSAVNQSGGNIAQTIGSYANPSSIAGVNTTRVDTYWLQQKLFDGVLVLRGGQLAQQDDYGVQEYGASYLLEPLGYALGNLFGNVTATFDPASKPGAELQVHPYRGFYLKSMLQGGDNNPYGNDPYGCAFNLSGPGVLATEIGYRTQGSTDGAPSGKEAVRPGSCADGFKTLFEGLPAVYKFGLYENFGNYTNPANGNITRGNYLVYGMINQAIFRQGHDGVDANRGLDAFIGGDYSPSEINFAYIQLTGGVRYTGLIPNRCKDVSAVGVVFTDFSGNYNTVSAGYTCETALEVNYRAVITPWLSIQPDFQIFFNPGGASTGSTAFLLGGRANLVF